MLARSIALVLLALGLAGCLPDIEVSRHLDTELDHPHTVIEKALASCPARLEEAETDCVKAAVAGLDAAALSRLVPGCRSGRECHLDYTTDERVGFVPLTASDYRVRWRVTIDLRHPVKPGEDVPITVEQI